MDLYYRKMQLISGKCLWQLHFNWWNAPEELRISMMREF